MEPVVNYTLSIDELRTWQYSSISTAVHIEFETPTWSILPSSSNQTITAI